MSTTYALLKNIIIVVDKLHFLLTFTITPVYTNKGVDIVVAAYYDPKENPNLVPGENANWEGKSD